MLHIVRNKIQKESWQLVKRQKSYSKSKNVKIMPEIFSLKIHKDAGTFKQPKTFLNKGTNHKKNYMEGLNSNNKNIKGGGSP